MSANRAVGVSLAARCIVAYEDRRLPYTRGKTFRLDEFSRDELTGLYLSVLTRFLDRKPVSVVERVAILELIGPDGAKNWARLWGEVVGDALGVHR